MEKIYNVINEHKSGTILCCDKSFDMFLQDELEYFNNNICFPCNHSKEDYATYRIDRNKNNEIIRVRGKEFSEEVKSELDEWSKRPNMFDACKALYGKGRKRQIAWKKITNYNDSMI